MNDVERTRTPAAAAARPVGFSDRGWFIGAGMSLAWTVPILIQIWARPALVDLVPTLLVVVFSAMFLATVPVMRRLPTGAARFVPAGSLFVVSLLLVPWIGADVRWLWTFVGVAIAVSRLSWWRLWATLLVLAGLTFAVGVWDDADVGLSALNAAVILSVSVMMATLTGNISTLDRLRAAQDQVAELAAERERSRVARDVHDILGHSLTVIIVKAELAGRLQDAGSFAARSEIAQIEQLARGALADVRATVHGFRGVSISGELAAARAALESADVSADLPGSTEQVPADRRELAGWVVREAVTNVVRHSGARTCRVRLDPRGIEVADDGCGPSAAAESGSGLTGLRERVEGSGARLTLGRSDLGGFRVRVTW
ncbi:sensor histidine kinase [Herbiconiux sp. CPCC 205716]|uniref:Sensor histidine kinase n=1 Tax=Herbiconiux gentiana TaxID=2970912 RepID=A0ABT2GK64_9MICO|nr:sensor histidine kinase [Herbiconiux gentiana]MCS5715695.1 sensor histidine kinase [Herbiconiux gentiana]